MHSMGLTSVKLRPSIRLPSSRIIRRTKSLSISESLSLISDSCLILRCQGFRVLVLASSFCPALLSCRQWSHSPEAGKSEFSDLRFEAASFGQEAGFSWVARLLSGSPPACPGGAEAPDARKDRINHVRLGDKVPAPSTITTADRVPATINWISLSSCSESVGFDTISRDSPTRTAPPVPERMSELRAPQRPYKSEDVRLILRSVESTVAMI